MPAQEMANSFSKAPPEAAGAPPPYSPYNARLRQELPWRIDKPSRRRSWEDGESRQRRYSQPSPSLNAAQMVLYRLRIMVAGEPAGAWGEFGGHGSQLRLLPNHIEACIENNAEVLARPSEEERGLLSHMARGRMDPSELAPIISEPDRGRRLRVADEQRSAYHPRAVQTGGSRTYRGQSSSDTQGCPKAGPR